MVTASLGLSTLSVKDRKRAASNPLGRPSQCEVRFAYSGRRINQFQDLCRLYCWIPFLPHFRSHKRRSPCLQVINTFRGENFEGYAIDFSILCRLPMNGNILAVRQKSQTRFIILTPGCLLCWRCWKTFPCRSWSRCEVRLEGCERVFQSTVPTFSQPRRALRIYIKYLN